MSCFHLDNQSCASALARAPLNFQVQMRTSSGSASSLLDLPGVGAVPAVQTCKWFLGFCSLQKLIRASLQLMGSEEELPLDQGVEQNSDIAQY